MRPLLLIHLILILLASTNFTIVTSVLDGERFEWCYYAFAWRSGFGFEYVSNYSLSEVVTYLGAYAVGVAGFYAAWKLKRDGLSVLGIVLSVIGMLSFSIEGSHWIIDHHRSLMAFSPVAMIVLSAVKLLLSRDVGEAPSEVTAEALEGTA